MIAVITQDEIAVFGNFIRAKAAPWFFRNETIISLYE